MRLKNIAIAIPLLALIAALGIYSRYGERYSLYRDAKGAARDIRAIDVAERACYEKIGRFVPPDDARRNGCQGVWSAVAEAERHGLAVEIVPNVSDYSVRIVPSRPARLVSLYVAQDGVIHFGTRVHPASSKTAVYHDQR